MFSDGFQQSPYGPRIIILLIFIGCYLVYYFIRDIIKRHTYDRFGFDGEGRREDKSLTDGRGFYGNGFNKNTGTLFDIDGYNFHGYDKDGYDRRGFEWDGKHKKTGKDEDNKGFNKRGRFEGYKIFNDNGYNVYGRHKSEYYKEPPNGRSCRIYHSGLVNRPSKINIRREKAQLYFFSARTKGEDINAKYDKDGFDKEGFNQDRISRLGTRYNEHGELYGGGDTWGMNQFY